MADAHIIGVLQQFATKHNLTFEQKGECGFGRACVGFLRDGNYVAFNPLTGDDYMPIAELQDERFYKTKPKDAYHKHDCLAVLVHLDNYDEALRQLYEWVNELETLNVSVIEYETNHTGAHLLIHGKTGTTLTIEKDKTKNKTIIDTSDVFVMGIALDEFITTRKAAIAALRPFAHMGQALWENKQYSVACPETVVMKHGGRILTLNQFYDAWGIIKTEIKRKE